MPRIIVEIKKTVHKCSECPHFANSMDGIYCAKEEEKGAYRGMIIKSAAEARIKIADKCPYLQNLTKTKSHAIH